MSNIDVNGFSKPLSENIRPHSGQLIHPYIDTPTDTSEYNTVKLTDSLEILNKSLDIPELTPDMLKAALALKAQCLVRPSIQPGSFSEDELNALNDAIEAKKVSIGYKINTPEVENPTESYLKPSEPLTSGRPKFLTGNEKLDNKSCNMDTGMVSGFIDAYTSHGYNPQDLD